MQWLHIIRHPIQIKVGFYYPDGVWWMWDFEPTEEFGRRVKRFKKDNPRELNAATVNLRKLQRALQEGANPLNLPFGFIHREQRGVLAIDQKGGGKSLAQARLYIYLDRDSQAIHLITLGDKGSQKDDVESSRPSSSTRSTPKRRKGGRMAKKRYADVAEMMGDLTEDPAFADDLRTHLARRALITELCAQRAARGLTQKDVADKLGCTQGRISRVESLADGELSMAILVKYADAIGLRVEITLMSKGTTLASQVKHHAFCIKRLTDRLAKLGSKDERIADGVGDFLKEAAYNLVRLIQSSAKLLPPQPDEASPALTIETCDDDDCDDEGQHEPRPTGTATEPQGRFAANNREARAAIRPGCLDAGAFRCRRRACSSFSPCPSRDSPPASSKGSPVHEGDVMERRRTEAEIRPSAVWWIRAGALS